MKGKYDKEYLDDFSISVGSRRNKLHGNLKKSHSGSDLKSLQHGSNRAGLKGRQTAQGSKLGHGSKQGHGSRPSQPGQVAHAWKPGSAGKTSTWWPKGGLNAQQVKNGVGTYCSVQNVPENAAMLHTNQFTKQTASFYARSKALSSIPSWEKVTQHALY